MGFASGSKSPTRKNNVMFIVVFIAALSVEFIVGVLSDGGSWE